MHGELIKNIYDRAPYNLKVLLTSLYGLKKRYECYGKSYYKQLDFLTETQFWNQEKLTAWQNEKLKSFFYEIYDKIPYYRKPQYLNLRSEFSDLSNLPIITKQVVKKRSKEFYNLEQRNVVWTKTSGTTGSPLIFPLTREAVQKGYAFRNMHYSWNGLCLHNRSKIAMIAGHSVTLSRREQPPFWALDAVNNHLYFSSYHLSMPNLMFYIKKLEDFNPLLLHGYPSSVFLLAIAYKRYGTKKLNLRGVYTSSETLLDFQRNLIEDAFQVKVFNYYGTSEMSCNIVECEKGELHLKSEHSYVEILNSKNKVCKPGENGRIISTNFNNTAFPLIRYDVGDIVVVSNNQISKCGRSGLLIDSIEGRQEDSIITPEGRIVGRLSILLKDSINIIEAQIEQHSIEEVIFRIVRGEKYTGNDEKLILKAARIRLGNSIRISFDYVDEIPRTSNGKFRFIISKIDPLFFKTMINS